MTENTTDHEARLIETLGRLRVTAATAPAEHLDALAEMIDQVDEVLAEVQLSRADPAALVIASHLAMEATMSPGELEESDEFRAMLRTRLHDAGLMEEQVAGPLRVVPTDAGWNLNDAAGRFVVDVPGHLVPWRVLGKRS